MIRWIAIAIGIAWVCGLPPRADAHPLDMGYLRVDTGDSIAITLDLDVNVVAQLLHVEPMTIDASVVTARAAELAAATYRMAPPAVDGKPCTWTTATAQLRGRSVTLGDRATCPQGKASWDLPFVKKMSATFQVLAKLKVGAEERVVVIDKSSTTIEVGASAPTTIGGELWAGIAHAGLAPKEWRGPQLPAGIHHLVFVLALLLAGGSLVRLLVMIGAFTVAHTAAVALAFAGVGLPEDVVGVLFSLVIAALAVAAVSRRFERLSPLVRSRWIAAAIAGLLHGFAIAPSLAHTPIALVGFDLGLLLAQLAILLALGPPVLLALRDASVRRYGVPAVGIAIAGVALFWVVRGVIAVV